MIDDLPFVLAVDVGTSSLKAVLYDTAGSILETTTGRYSYHSPQPDWAEANPEDWWQAFCAAIDELHRHGRDLTACRVIAFTGQMHTAVLLDSNGKPIEPAILWLDRRAAQETIDLQKKFNLPPYQLNSTYTLPKLLWLVRNNPEAIARARHVLWPKDYLRFRLTGKYLTDFTEAGGAALLDWNRLDWARERLEQIGIDAAILPRLCKPEDDAGPLLTMAADRFGFSKEIKVLTGAGDVLALITGAPPAPGRITCSLGSSSMVFLPLLDGKSIEDPQERIYTYPLLPFPMLGGVSSTTGAALQWAWQTLYPPETSFDQATALALAALPGSGGIVFLPFLSGERSPYWSDTLRGSFFGLSLTHNRDLMLRSVMEGIGFSLRVLLEIYPSLGIPLTEIALAGGGAVTTGWPQIIADICQLPVSLFSGQETVTRALYAYACQTVETDIDFGAAIQRTFGPSERITPRVELKMVYDLQFERYKALADFTNQLLAVRKP
jgi:xylulokinase